ncbi:MAG TPA: serine protease [Opitutaceae bacterium]|jgi:hypothetical protein
MKSARTVLSLAAGLSAMPAIGHALDLPGVQHATGLLRVDYASSDPRSAACFLYSNQRTAVTCLHAVANAAHVTVTFDSGVTNATVKTILKRYDLALLELAAPISATPLDPAASIPDSHAHLEAVGFPANLVNATSQRASLRAIGPNTVEGFVTSPEMRQQLENQGYPALDADVLDLESHVEPGMSGGPLVDKNGMVVGICDGGLENGTTELTWAIGANRISDLLASHENLRTAGGGDAPPVLFSSKLTAQAAGEAVVVGKHTFVKIRTLALEDLINSSHEPLGLSRLATDFAVTHPETFQFDLYRDESSGATFVVPSGARPQVEGNTITLHGANGLVGIRITLTDYNSYSEAIQQGTQFLYNDLPMAPYERWFPNNRWSYLQPVNYRSGLTIQREAFYRLRSGYGRPVQTALSFLTFAGYNHLLLSAAAIRVGLTADFATGTPVDISWGKAVFAIEMLTFAEQGEVTQAPPQEPDSGF